MVAMSTKNSGTAMQRAPEGISPVESNLAYWVNYVGYRLSHQLRRRTQEFGVTAAESVVLRKLSEHEFGATPSLLALRLGLTRGYLSRLAKRLDIKGLINRDKSASDRRTLTLTLTGYARAMLRYLAAAADENNARNFAGASDALLEPIERVMKWVVRRDRCRFVPPAQCRVIREHREGDADDGDDGDGEHTARDGAAAARINPRRN
jgi:DNA-binding MarR family transcriptional regulator